MTSYCSWDLSVILTTSAAGAVLLAVAAVSLVKYRAYRHTGYLMSKIICLSSATLCIGVFVGGALFLPLKVSVTDAEIRIDRAVGNVSIPLAEIRQIHRTATDETANSIRTFASGGLWGYLGKFKSANLGTYTMYVTDTSQMITVKTSNGTYLISCRHANETIKSVTEK